jgi:hypothetical protein
MIGTGWGPFVLPWAYLAILAAPPHRVAPSPPAVPIDAVDGIIEACRTHPLVALGEGAHGNEQGHAFRLRLVRDQRFAQVIDDVVVEFGNAKYQDVMDRFVRGEIVDDAALSRVWQDTTQPQPAWDAPIYEEFFRAIRDVNLSHAGGRQLRIVLGDPPIDWGEVEKAEDLRQWDGRGRHAAGVIRREVLEKGHHALIVYGDGHLFRVPIGETVVSLLEQGATRVFTIASPISSPAAARLESLQADVRAWRTPSLVMLRNTPLGAAAFSLYYPAPKVIRDGVVSVTALPERWRSLAMEDQFDALLYLGPPEGMTFAQLPPTLCADEHYMEKRLSRMAMAALPAQTDRLKDYCASVGRPR